MSWSTVHWNEPTPSGCWEKICKKFKARPWQRAFQLYSNKVAYLGRNALLSWHLKTTGYATEVYFVDLSDYFFKRVRFLFNQSLVFSKGRNKRRTKSIDLFFGCWLDRACCCQRVDRWNHYIVTLLFLLRYKRPINPGFKAQNFKELASLHYFNRPDRFYQLFYKMPKNKNVMIAHIGYIATVVCILVSFLAAFHNMSQFYGFSFYDRFRAFVGRPLIVIYSSIILTTILACRSLLKSEYEKYRNIS